MRSALVEFYLEDLTDETTGRLCWTVDESSAETMGDGGALRVTTAVCDDLFDDFGNATRANASGFLWSFADAGGYVSHERTGYCLDTRFASTARNALLVARPPPRGTGAGHGSFDVASTWVVSKRVPRGMHGTL